MPVSAQPPAKKARVGVNVSEEEFLAANPGQYTLIIKVPLDQGYAKWDFKGQELTVTASAADKLTVVKQSIGEQLGGMPVKKMKLSIVGGPQDGVFLNKDANTLAVYNVPAGTVLKLGVKERGGRKR